MKPHYFQIPQPEALGILGYQWYFSCSNDLNHEVDVFDHISPCRVSVRYVQLACLARPTSDVDQVHQGFAAQTVTDQDNTRRTR